MGINKAGSIDTVVVITASLVPVLPTRGDVLPSRHLSGRGVTTDTTQRISRRRHEHV